jgi:hypothetical protein
MSRASRTYCVVIAGSLGLVMSTCHRTEPYPEPDARVLPAGESDGGPAQSCAEMPGDSRRTRAADPFPPPGISARLPAIPPPVDRRKRVWDDQPPDPEGDRRRSVLGSIRDRTCQEFYGEPIGGRYGKYLGTMDEPVLSRLPAGVEMAYRFLWIRSFHHPLAVRVARTPSGTILVARELTGGEWLPGVVYAQERRELSEAQWSCLQGLVTAAHFWSLTSEREEANGTDGARWIIEGVRGVEYHVVDRWCPERGDPIRELAWHLVELSGLEPEGAVY